MFSKFFAHECECYGRPIPNAEIGTSCIKNSVSHPTFVTRKSPKKKSRIGNNPVRVLSVPKKLFRAKGLCKRKGLQNRPDRGETMEVHLPSHGTG